MAQPGPFFSTEAKAEAEAEAKAAPPPPDTLYQRVVYVPDSRVSIVPILDQWVEEGKTADRRSLQQIVKKLKGCKRFAQALEVSMWMSDRRYLTLSAGDLADRLDLLRRVQGLEHAENYFNILPKQMKQYATYGALLSCYAEEKSVEKAESLFQKMKEQEMSNSFNYNILMKLYGRTGELGKLESTLKEMKAKAIPPDGFTYGILMDAYANAGNIEGVEDVLKKIRGRPHWHMYAIAGRAYARAGLVDKAMATLKRSEELISMNESRIACGFLLTVYGSIGKKDEMHRIWNVCKSWKKAYNSTYVCMISALLKLDDLDGAEAIFKDWESQFTAYDFRVVNLLVGGYCRKGFLSKAEALMSEAASRGVTPFAATWECLARGYIEDGQIMRGVEVMRKALAARKMTPWSLSPENVNAILEYFKEQQDVETAEEFAGMVRQLVPLTREAYHGLLRTYLAAGRPVSTVINRMKEDGFEVDEETSRVLDGESL